MNEKVHNGGHPRIVHDWHLTQCRHVFVLREAEISGLGPEILSVRLLSEELTNEQVRHVLAFDDDRRGAVRNPVLTVVDGELAARFQIVGKLCIAFDAARAGAVVEFYAFALVTTVLL